MKIKSIAVVMSLLIMLLAPCFSGCLFPLSGSGNVINKPYDNSGFTRIEVSSIIEVEITQSSEYSINVTADDNIMDYFIVEQSGETLKLRLKSGYNYTSVTTIASITMPEISRLTMSGATSGTLTGFESAENIRVEVSGASSLVVSDITVSDAEIIISGASSVNGSLTANDVDFNISGASKLLLSGSGQSLDASVSGASDMLLDDFTVHNADVNVSGASNAVINMDGALDADISGASNLSYLGAPVMGDINISGASSIGKK